MAYPFTQLPTLREFIERVTSQYGAKMITPDGEVCGPRGQVKITSLVIKNGGKTNFSVIPDLSDDEVLLPDVLRSLCQQLGIPPKDFGMTLG